MRTSGLPRFPLSYAEEMYGWEESYKLAMLETDRSKLQERIEAAQVSNRRLQETNGGTIPEKSAMRFESPGWPQGISEEILQESDFFTS